MNGFTVLEVVIAAALISGLLVGLINIFGLLIQLGDTNVRLLQAGLILEEGAEAVRLLRDAGWSNLADLSRDTDYFLAFQTSDNHWQATTTNTFVDGLFERKFRVSAVYRDAGSQDIVPAGVLDPNTLLAEVAVSWRQKTATSSRSLSLYLTNLFAES